MFVMNDQCLRRWKKEAKSVSDSGGRPRKCVVFTYSRKPTRDPLGTRLGGVPYWPRDMDWPFCGGKKCRSPMSFVFQIDCRLYPFRLRLPGDLLVFHKCFDCWPWSHEEKGRSQITWLSAGLTSRERIGEEDVPVPDDPYLFGPYWGRPAEVMDIPSIAIEGTKLGGHPPMVQEFTAPCDTAGNPMKFFGAVGPVEAYQIDGVRQLGPRDRRDNWMWGDMGSLLLWYSRVEGELEFSWFAGCY